MLKGSVRKLMRETEVRKKGGVRRNRLKAMEHPLRADCLRLLIERGQMSPVEVSRELGAELSHVSYHMRRLEELDCAEIVATRQVRGAVEHFYIATERHFLNSEEWEGLEALTADTLIGDFVQWILDDFTSSRRAELIGKADGNFHLTRTPLVVDEQGYEEIMESAEQHRLFVAEVERRSAERRTESGESGIPVSSSVMFFRTPRRKSPE